MRELIEKLRDKAKDEMLVAKAKYDFATELLEVSQEPPIPEDSDTEMDDTPIENNY